MAAEQVGVAELAPSRLAWVDAGRVPGLDGLRAVAISVVLLNHAIVTHGSPLRIMVLRHVGLLGVSMFFTISGFLITTLLLRERNRNGSVSLASFYRRRALRIFPAYVCFLLAVYAMTRVGAAVVSSSDWMAAVTYTMNFVERPAWEIGHAWSLSVEEQFYLLWPPLVVLLTPRRALWVVGAYLVVAPLFRIAVGVLSPERLDLIEFLTPLHLDSIAAGCLLALLVERFPIPEWALMAPPRAAVATVLATILIFVAYIESVRSGLFNVWFQYSIVAAASVLIIWCAATSSANAVGRFLASRPVVFIGTISYSLYLWQEPFLNPRSLHWWTTWPQNLGIALACAVASHYLIERPFLRLKVQAT